uniref:Uncharacterized protein n=1 Tax=Anguilla anguilla TaxID=7936 RepID=A0A0E9RYQ5_ANGAN
MTFYGADASKAVYTSTLSSLIWEQFTKHEQWLSTVLNITFLSGKHTFHPS